MTRSDGRRTSWILAAVLIGALVQGPPGTPAAASEVATASASARVSPIPDVRKVARKLVRALNDQHRQVALRYASTPVWNGLRNVVPLFLLECYRTPRGPFEGFKYSGPMHYGCTLSDIGGYYYGIGLKKVQGGWKALDLQELSE